MTVERGKVVPLRPRKGGRKPPWGRPPRPPRRSTWRQAFRAVRPWLVLILIATGWFIARNPEAFEPPAFMQTEPQAIAGHFTRCGPGRGYYCVIDGDTFRIGQRKVRVIGIDTAEVDARCPAEAMQAEASTAALQAWLNRASFRITARLDEPVDRYGRELAFVKRVHPDGREERLADWMIANGGARPYGGEARQSWC
ncbi:MAG: thermonuclease family protein [Alteraurantiacibacter sp.]